VTTSTPPEDDGDRQPTPGRPFRVPNLLEASSAWAWRVLVLAAAFFGLFLLMEKLWLVILPLFTATLICALLAPAVSLLRRRAHFPRGVATWGVLLLGSAVLGGIGLFASNRASAEFPLLVTQVNKISREVRHFLITGPLHLRASSVDNVGKSITDFLGQHSSTVASGVVTAGRTVADVATFAVLTFFITFFLLYDGENIWNWLVGFFPRDSRQRMHDAGRRVWSTLTGYIGGTFVVAAFHGIVMGVTLTIVGVPLVAPLAVLIFIGSFIPIIGVVIFGGLAVVVTMLTVGPIAGVVVLAVLVVSNQIEGHLLQPLVVGRYVHLHPLAIAITLTGAALLAGLPGAIFGVPVVAAVNAAAKYLSGREDADGRQLPHSDATPPSEDDPESEDAESEDAESEDAAPVDG
jgi:putative heme transporter